MRRIVGIAVTIVLLLIAAAVAIPYLVPSSVYRAKMEEAAETALGRDVTISENVKLRVLPRIEARAGASSIANPDGFGDEAFAEMTELRAAVKLWPLLSKRVEIDEFVLVDPTIRLVQLKSGDNNWTFETKESDPARAPTETQSGGDFTAQLGDIRLVNGKISYRDDLAGQAHTLEKLNIVVGMDALNAPLRLDGDGVLDGTSFNLDATLTTLEDLTAGRSTTLTGDFKTELVTAGLKGVVELGDPIALALDFDSNIPSVPNLVKFAELQDVPAVGALGTVALKGRVEGVLGDLTVSLEKLEHSGGLFSAEGSGVVKLADAMTTDLKLEVSASDLQKIASTLDVALPAQEALGAAKFSTKVSGPLDRLSFTDMTFTHDSALLKAAFDGSATFTLPTDGGDPEIAVSGPFSIEAPQLRKLAGSADVVLPDSDEIYRKFSLSGLAAGNLTSVRISDAELVFDDIAATGDVSLGMAPDKPLSITGSLKTGAIDGTPYAVASGAVKDEKAAREAKSWEATPIELAFLEGVAVDVGVLADSLKFQMLDFGETELALSVQDGAVVADLVKTEFYNGAGDARITADTVNGVPTFSLAADLNGVNFEPFLGALTQMNLVNGNGRLKVSFSGQGATMADMMKSLSGSADISIDDGALQGVDFSKFENLSLQSFLTGDWRSALSQDASTDVKDFSSSFSIKNGVATSKNFIFKTDDMRIPGQIKLDLGGRSLGLTLSPTSSDSSVGLNGELPPLSLTGPWGGDLALGVDTSWVETKLKEAAANAVKDEIRDQLGDTDIGAIIGGGDSGNDAAQGAIKDLFVIPRSTPTPTPSASPASETAAPAPKPTPSSTPARLEDQAKDKLKEELDNLFK